MTSITSLHAHSATTPPPDSRQKDTLFCQVCGHESPIGGDWVPAQNDNNRTLQCPECQTVLGDRSDE